MGGGVVTKYLNTSNLRVSRDAALELMVHHLRLAAMFFECTSNDVDEKREEARRLFEEGCGEVTRWKDDGGIGAPETVKFYTDSPDIVAGMAWLENIEAIYEEMRKENP